MNKPTNPEMYDTLSAIDDVVEDLENLRGRVVDLEAMAHAAAQALEYLPYVPRSKPDSTDTVSSVTADMVSGFAPNAMSGANSDDTSGFAPEVVSEIDEPGAKGHGRDSARGGSSRSTSNDDTRVQLRRLQALVNGTANASFSMVDDFDSILERVLGAPHLRGKNGTSRASEVSLHLPTRIIAQA